MTGRDSAYPASSPVSSRTTDRRGDGLMNSSVSSSTSTLRRAPRQDFQIDRQTLNQLPDLEKLAAISAINRGFWRLIGPVEIQL
jgi:hypothetical protein